jgi:hypothetical protein
VAEGKAGRIVARTGVYLVALLVVPYIASEIGGHRSEARCSTGAECDLAGLARLGWGVTAFAVALLLLVVGELVLLVRRRRG